MFHAKAMFMLTTLPGKKNLKFNIGAESRGQKYAVSPFTKNGRDSTWAIA